MQKSIGLELFSACNLRCKMCTCYHGFTGDRLEKDTVMRLFDEIAEYNRSLGNEAKNSVSSIRFDGNTESLLVENIHEYIRYANERIPGIITYLITNGLLLDSGTSNNLIEAGLRGLIISMTGSTKEIYKNFQGYGLSDDKLLSNFETVKRNASYVLKKARGTNLNVMMSYIINEDSKNDLYHFMRYWDEMDAGFRILNDFSVN